MMDQLVEARGRISVQVNGILCPVTELPAALQRFTAPAVFFNEGSAHQLTQRGSCFRLRYRDRFFVLLTRHQLGNIADAASEVERQNFSIMVNVGGRRMALTPSIVSEVNYSHAHHANLSDVLIVQYTAEQLAGGHDCHFLDLNLATTRDELADAAITQTFAIGYPASAMDMTLDDDGNPVHIDMRWIRLHLADAMPAPMDPENRRIVVELGNESSHFANPDGMSGAPVFAVWRDRDRQLRLALSGMITNARTGRYAVYRAGYLRRLLDHHIDQ